MNVSPVAFGFVVSLLLHVLVLGGYAEDAARLVGKAVLAVIEPARQPDAAANDREQAAKPKPADTPKPDAERPQPKPESKPEPKPETKPSEKPRPPEQPQGPKLPPRAPEPPPAPEPDVVEVTPGIEGGSQTSMNWIGYDEYQEHLARLATQEQAAFDLESSGGGARSVTAEPQPLPQGPEGQAPSLVDRAEVAEQPATVTPAPAALPEPAPPKPAPPAVATTTPAEAKPAQPSQPEPAPALSVPGIVPDPAALDRAPTTDPSTAPPTAPDPSKPPEAATPLPSPAAPKDAAAVAKPTPAPAPTQPTAPATVEKPGQERPQVPPQVDAPGTATNPNADKAGPVTDGAKSDKQSAATSVIDVPASLWKNGKPLAREGLNIKTRRVELTTLTQVSGNYRNPQCDIYFDHLGKPVQVKIVESSGMKDAVDEPVVDTLYRWRASGKQISQLQPGQLARFRVRIYLR
ncbi:MAG: hypothetical protein KGR22_03265 [Planctomycetes bacterium]|nr:hypothetical protein [Planctomycetota bacterium]